MGGLGPGIGGFEILVIGLVALLVVGPKDLPVLMRRIGQVMSKARGMAAEFRASFDDMARQSELDDLRKEVEALRTKTPMHYLGKDADAAYQDIKAGLERPLDAPAPALTSPEGWDDPGPEMMPLDPPLVGEPDALAPVKAKSVRRPKAVAVIEDGALEPTAKTGTASAAKRKTTRKPVAGTPTS